MNERIGSIVDASEMTAAIADRWTANASGTENENEEGIAKETIREIARCPGVNIKIEFGRKRIANGGTKRKNAMTDTFGIEEKPTTGPWIRGTTRKIGNYNRIQLIVSKSWLCACKEKVARARRTLFSRISFKLQKFNEKDFVFRN